MNNDLTAFEKIPVQIFKGSAEAPALCLVNEIAALIHARQAEGKPCVLGTGYGLYANAFMPS